MRMFADIYDGKACVLFESVLNRSVPWHNQPTWYTTHGGHVNIYVSYRNGRSLPDIILVDTTTGKNYYSYVNIIA